MRRSRLGAVRGLVVLLAMAVIGSPAIAQPPTESEPGTDAGDEDARALFQEGSRLFEAGAYEEALARFGQAYELTGRVALAYNVGLCLERLGRHGEAATWFSRYAETMPPGEERSTLEERIRRLRARDAARRGTGAGETEASVEHDAGDGGFPVLPAVLLVASGVALAAGAVFGVLAAGEDSSLDEGCSPRCSADQVSTLRTYVTVADVALAIGVVAGVTGVVLLLLGGSPEDAHDVASGTVVRF